jgi:hypothetical protein
MKDHANRGEIEVVIYFPVLHVSGRHPRMHLGCVSTLQLEGREWTLHGLQGPSIMLNKEGKLWECLDLTDS